MAKNQVQFQKGISLPEFLKQYGAKSSVAVLCSEGSCPVASSAPNASILVTVK